MTKAITPNVRVFAVDDAPFQRRRGAKVMLVGVLTRGARHIEGVFSTAVVRDGWGATAAIAALARDPAVAAQARYILLDGVAVGGFNVVDLPALAAAAGLGVIAVMRKQPDLAAIERALGRVSRGAQRMAAIRRAGTIHRGAGPGSWFQCVGCEPETARAVLVAVTSEGNYPEPLRIAHLVGSGVVLGRTGSRA